MKSLISVVIPFKNASKTIARAINSIKTQSITEFNCVLIDDGSTDSGYDSALSLIDERFKLIKNPVNLGVSTSRNIGNALAESDIICVLDADDEALPNRLENTINAFASNENLALFCGAAVISSSHPQIVFPSSYDPFGLATHNPFVHSSVAYRKAFLLEHKIFYSPSLLVAHDYDLYRQIYFAGGMVGASALPVSIRHDAPSGLMASHPVKMVSETITVRQKILSDLFPELSVNQIRHIAMFFTFNRFDGELQRESIFKFHELLLDDIRVPSEFKKLINERLSFIG